MVWKKSYRWKGVILSPQKNCSALLENREELVDGIDEAAKQSRQFGGVDEASGVAAATR